jgi:hypothetical protein
MSASTTRRIAMQVIAALVVVRPTQASENASPQIRTWSDGRMAIWNEKRGWLPLPR